MDYEKMWNDHKKWLNSGVVYYTATLENFVEKNTEVYDHVANVLATYEFHLDSLETIERTEKNRIGESVV